MSIFSSFLRSAGPGINAASQLAGGYQNAQVQSALRQQEAARQAKEDQIKELITGATVKHLNAESNALGQPKPAEFEITQDGEGNIIRVPKTGGASSSVLDSTGNPIKGKTTPHEPLMGSKEWKAAKQYEASLTPHPEPLVQVQQSDGSVVYVPRSQAVGKPAKIATAGAATKALAGPIAAKVGQFGEMLKKAADIIPITESLDVELPNSAAQDIAERGFGIGHARIPGTQGIGSMMLNKSPNYAKYQATLSPFILAAAHALSGARINMDQVDQIRHSIEIKPGDGAEVRAQKHKNLIDLVNSIGGALPANAVAEQEDQMEQNAITLMESNGYRKAHREGVSALPTPTKSIGANPFADLIPKK